MAVSCGLKCAKSVLVTFNLLFWLSGCTFLWLGIWIFLEPTKAYLFHLVTSESLGNGALFYLAYALVALGGVVLLVGFFGCCGALQESRFMLLAYFAFLFILLCAELSVAVVTLVYRKELLSGLETRLTARLTSRYGHDTNTNNDFTQAVDIAQFKFNCCGIHEGSDYLQTQWWNDSAKSSEPSNVPATCCVLAQADVEVNAGSPISVVSRVFGGTVEEPWQHPQLKNNTACQSPNMTIHTQARYTQGCFSQLERWFKQESGLLITAGIGIASFQVLGMILSLCLCQNLSRNV